jgi:hypothetical protein
MKIPPYRHKDYNKKELTFKNGKYIKNAPLIDKIRFE